MFNGNDARPRIIKRLSYYKMKLQATVLPYKRRQRKYYPLLQMSLPLVANEDNNSAVEMAPLDVDVSAAKKKVRCLVLYIYQFFAKRNI